MAELDSGTSIVSYAVITTKYNESKNILLSFLPLVESALCKVEANFLSRDELNSLLKELYSYEIPKSILSELLNILDKQKKISMLIHENIEIHKSRLEDSGEEFKRQTKLLINEFRLFAIKNGKSIDESCVIEVLSKFIYSNALLLNDFFRNDSNLEEEIVTCGIYDKLIIEFFLRERSNNSKCFDYIETIYSGASLASLLQLSVKDINAVENLNIKNVVLDSNYIFRLLDLQTQYEYEAAKDTYEILKEYNCKFWIYKDTINQIIKILKKSLVEIRDQGDITYLYTDELRFSGIRSAYLRRKLSPAMIQEIISNLLDILSMEYGIELLPEPYLIREVIAEDISSLQAIKYNSDFNGIEHDLKLVNIIRDKRGSNTYDMNNADWWLLTDDLKLAKWCQASRGYNIIPECLTEAQLGALFWLKDPQKTNDVGLTNTILALRNRNLYDEKQYKKITEEIIRQKERYINNPHKIKRLALLFSSQCLSVCDFVDIEEQNQIDAIFDKKIEEADKFYADHKNLEAENKSIKELVSQFREDKQKAVQEAASAREKIKQNTLAHIETLKCLSEEMEKAIAIMESEKRIINKKKSKSLKKYKLQISLIIALIFVIIIMIAGLIENKTDMLDNYNITSSISAFLFLMYLMFILGANKKNEIFKAIFNLFYKHYVNKVNRLYNNKISNLEQQIDKSNTKSSEIQNQISELLSSI